MRVSKTLKKKWLADGYRIGLKERFGSRGSLSYLGKDSDFYELFGVFKSEMADAFTEFEGTDSEIAKQALEWTTRKLNTISYTWKKLYKKTTIFNMVLSSIAENIQEVKGGDYTHWNEVVGDVLFDMTGGF